MKIKNKAIKFISLLLVIISLVSLVSALFHTITTYVYAATTPSLGASADFGILSSTYTNTVGGTTINGDLGYNTGPAMAPTVNGTTHISDATHTQAGTDQGSALSALASQSCTHTFPAGAVDLATDTSHGTIGIYTPGVYCTTTSSAASIGTGGITLSGSGTYIFRIDGAFTTVSSSVVTLSAASACDVFWTPTSATTLGANSTFEGTIIDDSGITIGDTVTWTGRALAFSGTVSTTSDTITVPSCASPTATPTPTASPTPTPTPTTTASTTSTSSSSSSSSSSSECPTLSSVVPNIIESSRFDADSIFISWGPYSGVDTFSVRYGPTNGNWLYETNITGFSTTINALAANQPFWFQVAARNSCSVGSYGTAVLVGGEVGTSSPGFPNTFIPRLPNTGYGPNEKNSSLSL